MQSFILSAGFLAIFALTSFAADGDKTENDGNQVPPAAIPTARVRNQNPPPYDPNIIAPGIQGEFEWPPRTYGGPTLDALPPFMEFGGPGVEHRYVHASDYAHLLQENACPTQIAKGEPIRESETGGESTSQD